MTESYRKLAREHNLENLMKEHCIDKKRLAQRLGVDGETVNKYLQEVSMPRGDILYKMQCLFEEPLENIYPKLQLLKEEIEIWKRIRQQLEIKKG